MAIKSFSMMIWILHKVKVGHQFITKLKMKIGLLSGFMQGMILASNVMLLLELRGVSINGFVNNSKNYDFLFDYFNNFFYKFNKLYPNHSLSIKVFSTQDPIFDKIKYSPVNKNIRITPKYVNYFGVASFFTTTYYLSVFFSRDTTLFRTRDSESTAS